MTHEVNRDKIYLTDIIDFIDEIIDFSHSDRDSKKTISAIMHNLILIGEASKKLSSKLKITYANIPWREIGDTRNRLVHDYAKVDLVIVWRIVDSELSTLRQKIETILKSIT